MFGIGEDLFGQAGIPGGQPGPLGNLEDAVAGTLNSADQNHLYLPAGPGGIITVPRPQYPGRYRAAGYRPAAPMPPGQQRAGEPQRPSLRAQAAIVFVILAALVVAPVWIFTNSGPVTSIVAAADAALSMVLYMRAKRREE
jgi:hypothetical protein